MKQILITELSKPVIDVPKLVSLIENGKPSTYLRGLFTYGFEDIGLFGLDQGLNIFHILARKGVLSTVLPTFFGLKSQSILSREKASLDTLKGCMNAFDADKLTPVHIAVKHNPVALEALSKYGLVLSGKNYDALLQQYGDKILESSPLEYIFNEDVVKNFLVQTIRAGCTNVFKLLSEHTNVRSQLLQHLSYIIQKVNELKTSAAYNVFATIFQDNWKDILIADKSTFTKIMQLMKVVNNTKKELQLPVDNYSDLTAEDWSQLLQAKSLKENTKILQQSILRKCASKFLDGTLTVLRLEDFTNSGAIDNDKLQKLNAFIQDASATSANDFTDAVLAFGRGAGSSLMLINQTMDSKLVWSSAAAAASVDDNRDQSLPLLSTVAISVDSVQQVAIDMSKAAAESSLDENMRQLRAEPAESVFQLVQSGVIDAKALNPEKIEKHQDVILESLQGARASTDDDSRSSSLSLSSTSMVSAATSSSLMPPPVISRPVKAKAPLKVVTIQEYAAGITTCLSEKRSCLDILEKELGSDYTQLHSFVSMASQPDGYFGKVIAYVAKQLNAVPKSTGDFLNDYIGSLNEDDLMTTANSKKSNAYSLACRDDQVDIAKLLLNKGLELGIYSNTASIFETPIQCNSTKIMEYLLNKQSIITIDWFNTLYAAITSANISAIGYYINSGTAMVQVVTDIKGAVSAPEKKYTILNKALNDLYALSELRNYKKESIKEVAIQKISKLCECIKMMIDANKVYYGTEELVTSKALELLKFLAKRVVLLNDEYTDKIAGEINSIKDSVISHYMECKLTPDVEQKFITLASGGDIVSRASNITIKTSMSVFQDLATEAPSSMLANDEQLYETASSSSILPSVSKPYAAGSKVQVSAAASSSLGSIQEEDCEVIAGLNPSLASANSVADFATAIPAPVTAIMVPTTIDTGISVDSQGVLLDDELVSENGGYKENVLPDLYLLQVTAAASSVDEKQPLEGSQMLGQDAAVSSELPHDEL